MSPTFDTLVVGLVVLAAAAFLVRRFTKKGGGCASCPPGCHCGGKSAGKAFLPDHRSK